MGKKLPSFNEFHIGEGKTKRIYSLNCPFPIQINIKQNGTILKRVEPFRYSDKKKIIDRAKKEGYEIEVLPMSFSAPEICPKCREIGVPSFQQNSETQESNINKRKTLEESSWWLRYYHKQNRTTCWIHKYVGNLSQFEDRGDKPDFQSSLISHAIRVIKKEYLESILKNKNITEVTKIK